MPEIMPEIMNNFYGSCGKSGSSEGTEGSIYLFCRGDRMVKFSWACEPGKQNTWDSTSGNSAFSTEVTGGNKEGAIGDVTLKLSKA